jgi:hypothetical protein
MGLPEQGVAVPLDHDAVFTNRFAWIRASLL